MESFGIQVGDYVKVGAFVSFGIQVGDYETPVQAKTERHHFEKGGSHPGG